MYNSPVTFDQLDLANYLFNWTRRVGCGGKGRIKSCCQR
jgi:hypothetical protein